MTPILKSIGAILAGLATIFILSIVTDILLENAGVMKMNAFNDNAQWVNLVIIFSRLIYDILGAYVAARLAPTHPMRHALIIGLIGIAINFMGAIMTWTDSPHWLAIILVILPLPCAWIGAKLRK